MAEPKKDMVVEHLEFSSPNKTRVFNQFLGIKHREDDEQLSTQPAMLGLERLSRIATQRKSHSVITLPQRFLLGGNIADPLNLQGLIGSTDVNSSPSKSRDQILNVVVPKNLTDPLNLNEECGSVSLTSVESSSCKTIARKHVADIVNASQLSDPDDKHEAGKSASKNRFNSVNDRVVSPAIRQFSQKRKKHRVDGGSKHKKLILADTNSTMITAKDSTTKASAKKYCRGNYPAYYGYRNFAKSDDPRLQFFTRELFEGKDVLDIGCNSGIVTLTVARDFSPHRIVGLDIDPRLIESAKRNVRNFMSKNETYPNSMKTLYGPVSACANISADAMVQANAFPHNVLFQVNDYVSDNDDELKLQREEYDVILALSVTKWIHLNHGDAGLRRAFLRMIRQLRPGGKLVLEAQPWSSYKRKKKLTDKIFKTYQSITFLPDQFNDYLLSSDVGFVSCELLGTPLHESKGFQRPVYVFTKSSTAS